MSHSHVLEWISGSFIQSHCPWPTLWAISMFSMLLAVASAIVPTSQPTFERLRLMTIRAATSSVRCRRIVRRMYAASLAPSASSILLRTPSSSRPESFEVFVGKMRIGRDWLIATIRPIHGHARCSGHPRSRRRSPPNTAGELPRAGRPGQERRLFGLVYGGLGDQAGDTFRPCSSAPTAIWSETKTAVA